MANWQLVGEVIVSNISQKIPVLINAETFRITTTILNLDDWNIWKFKSGAYLEFLYSFDNSSALTYSPPYYIKVLNNPTIYEFKIPQSLKQDGWILRTPFIKRASRYLPLTPNDMFAGWIFRLEAFE